MKIFLFMLLSFSIVFSTSVESKIKKSKKALSSKKVQYKKMDKQLSSLAKKIYAAKKDRKKLESKLSSLSKNIKANEVRFKKLQQDEKKYSERLVEFNMKIDKNQKKFLKLVSKKFSLALALEELNQPTQESVMMREAYKLYAKKNLEAIEKLKKDINFLKSKKDILKKKKESIKKILAGYESERKEYKNKKEKKDKLVKNLARDKAIYKKRFEKIRASRKSLEKKLAKLKIIKRSHDKAAKAKKIAKENARLSAREEELVKVSASVGKYRGNKTISPLKGARLIKRFGTYIDPIYKFKIFNKSITLKSSHKGAKVKSILKGRIVFAEDSGGMLGRVVIIEHANQLHTIYAKLARLAPGIHVGKEVRVGSVLGKVNKSLMFEVTKNNKHMNPLKLIRL